MVPSGIFSGSRTSWRAAPVEFADASSSPVAGNALGTRHESRQAPADLAQGVDCKFFTMRADMTDGLAVAVARPPYLSEAVAASAGALLLVIVGAIGLSQAGAAVRDLAPTVGFLAAMLLIAEGCRRDGLFDAMGALMARGAQGSPQRLLAFVFAIAAAVTAVLSLDANVVLLTPVVFATAARMRTSAKPHVYACAHLANSASLLLPVSNLTNLLAFHASKLSFLRFAALMALPTIAAVGVEWVVFRRFFAVELRRPRRAGARPA